MPQPDDWETLTVGRRVSPEHFARVRALFEAALECPPPDRKAFLERACATDRALLAEVEGMLLAEGKEGSLDRRPSSAPEEGRFPAGTVLAGRYRILGLLGRGGMGEVYKTFDLILNQIVALKFLSPNLFSEAALMRFRNEVRIARQVSHPSVCRVYDLGMVEGLHFLSMEYIDGEDLASLLRRIGRLPQDKAIEFTRKICAGLAAAHDRGVLHRDLKPSNIMIDGRGQPRITDFGLAALAQEIPLSDLRSGTPAYMSPEQKAGKDVTTRSDIYSLGLVLYEMFTGKARKDTQSAPSDLVRELEPTLERLILRCLDEDPKRRPTSAYSVAMALPGADPIAAALAAGETPSPEMVAASHEQEGFTPRAVAICMTIVLLALGGHLAQVKFGGLVTGATLEVPPDAMADRVQGFLRSLGYTQKPGSEAHGYWCCRFPPLRELADRSLQERTEYIASHRPAIVTFYYRQQDAEADRRLIRFPDTDPTPPGFIQVQFDAKARLLELDVHDVPAAAPPQALSWPAMFAWAGLDPARFSQVDPSATGARTRNEQVAWTGTFSSDRPEPVRVEAASWNGWPVQFRVVTEVGPAPPVDGVSSMLLLPLTSLLVYGTLLAAAGWIAWRNLNSGRADRRGARVLVTLTFCLQLLILFLAPRHIVRVWPESLLAMPLGCWILYVAAEPFIRRNWPNALISWSRLCDGRFRNSLVASHILAGATAAILFASLQHVVQNEVVVRGGGVVADPQILGFRYLGSTGEVIASIASSASQGLLLASLFVCAVLLVRLVIRRLWLADLVAGALMVTPMANNAGVLVGFIVGPAWIGFLWLLRRFGFLAFLSVFVLTPMMVYFPLIPSGWAAARSMTVYAVPLAAALWSAWVILSAPRVAQNASAGS